MIKLKFAELHSPLFLAGTNLQMKLDPTKRHGLSLAYDRAEKELIVSFDLRGVTETAIVPVSNVVSMWPEVSAETDGPKRNIEQATRDVIEAAKSMSAPRTVEIIPPRASAQVSTPQSHVFAGPGAGDTGQEAPKAKKAIL